MASKVNIFNLALTNIAAKAQVQRDTEESNEAIYCLANFDVALEIVLEDHDWSFASAYDDLAQLKESSDDVPPPVPWIYEYAYPSEAVVVREIVRDTDNEEEVPFQPALNDAGTGKVIHTDKQSAKARYTKRITNVTLLTPRAAEAVGWKLATMIVIPLVGDLKLKQNAEQSYLNSIAEAKKSDLNEGVNRKAPDPSSIQART